MSDVVRETTNLIIDWQAAPHRPQMEAAGDALADHARRLARILAVEQGREEHAPEGWTYSEVAGWWRRHEDGTRDHISRTWALGPIYRVYTLTDTETIAGEEAGSYLEAMEAADAARKVNGD